MTGPESGRHPDAAGAARRVEQQRTDKIDIPACTLPTGRARVDTFPEKHPQLAAAVAAIAGALVYVLATAVLRHCRR